MKGNNSKSGKLPGTDDRRWAQAASLDVAREHGLRPEEFSRIRELLGRDLNLVEVGVVAALFSEHCSYKSSRVHLKGLPTEGPRVIEGPGENAGVVDIGDNQAVVFKVESHNHPSFIEPYQGAATGVGGIMRDVFTMGARPLALMNGLRFGEPGQPRTPELLQRSVAGIGGYGNCMGVPTVRGELFFHPSYNGNCLVNAFCLGLVEHDKIFRGRAAGIGNCIVYVGSKTGRDGIHGATMASAEFDDNSQEKRPTVQVGDPFQEKLLLEACLEAMASGAVVGIQDMGAAGMTSSTYEMADRAGTGVRIHLDRVPQREDGMNPYEIMLSESQERMLMVVERARVEEVLTLLRRWEVDAVSIGEVIEGKDVELWWYDECISRIPAELLTSNVPLYRWPEAPPADQAERTKKISVECPKDLSATWLQLLSSANLCSRAAVYRQYDSTVRSNTVVHPGGDAAVIRIKAAAAGGAPEKGVAVTLDCNSRWVGIDPRQGTAHSLAEAIRNVSAVGAEPIGISDCLNFGSPERPEGMWQLAESIRGLGEAAREFGVPIVSGNVSLYNETKGQGILPTPTLAVVGVMPDAAKAVSIWFRPEGAGSDKILLLGATDPEALGGSEYAAQIHGREYGQLPTLDIQAEKRTAAFVRELITKGLLASCHDLSSGGLAVALFECCAGPRPTGATMSVDIKGRSDGILFAETGARYLVSVAPKHEQTVRQMAQACGVSIEGHGTVGGDTVAITGHAQIRLAEAVEGWQQGLSKLMGEESI